MSLDERAQISKVAIQGFPGGLTAKLDELLPETSGSGFFGGALGGFLGGFHPQVLFMGGPILTTPVTAVVAAACGAAVSEVKEPAVKLRAMASEVGLSEFHAQLRSTLDEVIAANRSAERIHSPEVPADTILEISEIKVELGGEPTRDDSVCHPRLRVVSRWKAISADDGRELERRQTICGNPVSGKTFAEWFADPAAVQAEIRTLLGTVAWQIARDLILGAARTSC